MNNIIFLLTTDIYKDIGEIKYIIIYLFEYN